MFRIIFILFLLNENVFADGTVNTCWGEPLSIIPMELSQSSSFQSFKKDSEVKISWGGNGKYYISCSPLSPSFKRYYHKITISLPPSNINPGYFKLNNDIDVRVIFYDDNAGPAYYAPFQDIVSGGTISPVTRPSWWTGYMNSGITIFRLRRDIIGGVISHPGGTEILQAYRGWGYATYDKPVYILTTNNILIGAPTKCSINSGEIINVNFHNINSSLLSIDGSTYSQKISLSINCSENVGNNVLIKLISDKTPFSDDFITTNNKNAGIAIKYNNKLIKPWDSFPIVMSGLSGRVEIDATPVKNPGKTITAGDFSASATLVLGLP